LDSAVMVRSKTSWTEVLSDLSKLPPDKCHASIDDLTFDFGRSVDLHVQPFVPLDRSTMKIALAPHFPLHSAPDENILRVCSQLRPSFFSATTLEKESEMVTALRQQSPRFAQQGPITLPQPTPDIDLIITDEESSTIVLAEMKWVRKTLRPVELKDRDADVLKGIRQLQHIRQFLTAHPDHLRSLGRLPRRLHEYENVHYLLVARDHWLWAEPMDGIAIVEFSAFSSALAQSADLRSAEGDLLTYDWLPVEGRDFKVRYEAATVNGVGIEHEVFYAP
jgi:hypothetical protein